MFSSFDEVVVLDERIGLLSTVEKAVADCPEKTFS
jgi:hypothetical protein